MTYLILVLVGLLLIALIYSATAYNRMLKTYKKYDKEFAYCNLTGYQFACFAIDRLRLKTKIAIIDKELEECYLPRKNIVCISTHTANSKSISSICVTAHELGHAVQNKQQNLLFVLQSCLQTLGKLSSWLLPPIFVAGIVMIFIPSVADIGNALLLVSLFAILIIFLLKILTIPVEIQASKIAKKFLQENFVLDSEELKHGSKVLDSAAGTYIASLFMPILRLFRSFGRAFRR